MGIFFKSLVVLATMGAGTGFVHGQEANPSNPDYAKGWATIGEKEFVRACASCHGKNGEGHGPIAALFSDAPADLSVLRQNNGGVFPFNDVYKIVDGRNGIRAHGSEMPVWGDRFVASMDAEDKPAAEITALARLTSIVYYVESIQK